jgi:hypothetical protein
MSRIHPLLRGMPALVLLGSLIGGAGVVKADTAPFIQTFHNSMSNTVEGNAPGMNAVWLGNFSGGVEPYTVNVTWGDGTNSVAENLSPDGFGGTVVTGWHTYVEEGSAVISLHVVDSGGSFIDDSFPINIDDASLDNFQLQPFRVGKKSTKPVILIINFQDLGITGTPGDFRASVGWGDGTSSTCPSSACWFGSSPTNPGDQRFFALFGSHSYSKTGTYTVTMQVSDDGGSVGPVVQTTGSVVNS